MIFDYDLDRALWTMLSGSSVHRDEIAYFLRTLPVELVNDIRRALEDKKHGFFDRNSYDDRYYKIWSNKNI